MNKPCKEINLLGFQIKIKQMKIVKKDFLDSAGLKDLLVPAAGIKNITLLPSANCISARYAYVIVSKSGHNHT